MVKYKQIESNIRNYNVYEIKGVKILISFIEEDHLWYEQSIAEFKFNSWPVGILNGLMLDKKGLYIDEIGKISWIQLCNDCHSDLESNKMPAYALANGFYTGTESTMLPKLNWIEEMCIARIRTNMFIVKLSQCSDDSQLGYKGHILSKAQDPDSLLNIPLPLSTHELHKSLQVVFVNSSKTNMDTKKWGKLFTVSRSNILQWLNWLKKTNPVYSNVVIDKTQLACLENENIMQALIGDDMEIDDSKFKDLSVETGIK